MKKITLLACLMIGGAAYADSVSFSLYTSADYRTNENNLLTGGLGHAEALMQYDFGSGFYFGGGMVWDGREETASDYIDFHMGKQFGNMRLGVVGGTYLRLGDVSEFYGVESGISANGFALQGNYIIHQFADETEARQYEVRADYALTNRFSVYYDFTNSDRNGDSSWRHHLAGVDFALSNSLSLDVHATYMEQKIYSNLEAWTGFGMGVTYYFGDRKTNILRPRTPLYYYTPNNL